MSEQLSDALRADPERSGQILVEHLLASVSADNPRLPELITAAALPRAFDKAVLATLTGQDQADAEFSKAFSELVAFPFVYERAADMYSLHDSIRSVLLASGGIGPTSKSTFGDCLPITTSATSGLSGRPGTRHCGGVMRRINVSRWSAASERTEDLLIRRAIEALHVALMIGPDEGWQRMIDMFIEFEGQSRYRLCGMLVGAFAEHIDDVPTDARAPHMMAGRLISRHGSLTTGSAGKRLMST